MIAKSSFSPRNAAGAVYAVVVCPSVRPSVRPSAQTGIAGRLKMHDLKIQDWKMADNILANSEQNYGVWKMQDWKMTDKILANSGQNYVGLENAGLENDGPC